MMRLPWFRYLTPSSVEETVTIAPSDCFRRCGNAALHK